LSPECRLTVTVRPAREGAEIEAAMRLREDVFLAEQGVSREEEFDDLDDAATQLVAVDEKGVLATCRLRFGGTPGGADLDEGTCKLERMAVEKRARGLGVGSRLLAGAEREAAERGARLMVANAQTRAQDFYAGGGFEPEGELFMEAGIEHVKMSKQLAPVIEEPG
jgi:predicted GNAT family N-acyltransferase